MHLSLAVFAFALPDPPATIFTLSTELILAMRDSTFFTNLVDTLALRCGGPQPTLRRFNVVASAITLHLKPVPF